MLTVPEVLAKHLRSKFPNLTFKLTGFRGVATSPIIFVVYGVDRDIVHIHFADTKLHVYSICGTFQTDLHKEIDLNSPQSIEIIERIIKDSVLTLEILYKKLTDES